MNRNKSKLMNMVMRRRNVSESVPLAINSPADDSTLTDANVGFAYAGVTVVATGGSGNYSYSAVSGMPDGIRS